MTGSCGSKIVGHPRVFAKLNLLRVTCNLDRAAEGTSGSMMANHPHYPRPIVMSLCSSLHVASGGLRP